MMLIGKVETIEKEISPVELKQTRFRLGTIQVCFDYEFSSLVFICSLSIPKLSDFVLEQQKTLSERQKTGKYHYRARNIISNQQCR